MTEQPEKTDKNTLNLRSAYLAAVLLVLLGIIYSPLFTGSTELAGDDSYYIDTVKDLGHTGFPRIWTTPTKFEYFPVTISAYAIQYGLWGENPKLFHLTNLLIFFLIGLTMVSLSRALNRDREGPLGEMSFLCSALLLLHPVNIESVSSISSIKELLYALFGLISIRLFITGGVSGKALAFLFAVLSQLSKGTAVMLPFIFFAYEYLYREDRSLKKALFRASPYFLPAGVIFWVQFQVASGSNVVGAAGLTAGARVGGVVRTVSTAVWKILFPVNLSFDYDITWPGSFNFGVEWVVPVCIAVILTYLFLKKRYKVLFLCLLALIPFFPYANAVPLKHVVQGNIVYYDHYLLFSLAGASPLMTRGALTLPGRLNKRLFVFFALFLGAVYAAADYRLAGFWRTQAELYGRVIELSPRLSRAYYFLGKDYLEKERYDKALELFQKASSMGQTPPDNYYSWLGNAYAFSEDYEKAVAAYREQLRTKPDEKAALQNLSSALIMLKRYDEATAVVDRLLLLYPGDDSALFNKKVIEDARQQR